MYAIVDKVSGIISNLLSGDEADVFVKTKAVKTGDWRTRNPDSVPEKHCMMFDKN